MSISDYTGTKKAMIGMASYTTPGTKMEKEKYQLGKIWKSKKLSYIEQIMKEDRCLKHVYDQNVPFGSDLPKFLNKFTSSERRTIAGDIHHKAKKKETSSPSVHDYDPYKNKEKSLGNYKLNAKKITFAEEAQFLFGDNPMPGKYDAMDMDKMKSKPRYTKIYDGQRFKKEEKNDKPSPQTYDVIGSIANSQWKKQSSKGAASSTFGSAGKKSIF